MKLTNRCKVDFKKWLINKTDFKYVNLWETLCNYPQAMQYVVYVDFFDSVGIIIELERLDDVWDFYINGRMGFFMFKTRPEIRIEAIKKANKTYNTF